MKEKYASKITQCKSGLSREVRGVRFQIKANSGLYVHLDVTEAKLSCGEKKKSFFFVFFKILFHPLRMQIE